MIFIVIFAMLGLGLLFCMFMSFRNDMVYKIRISFIDDPLNRDVYNSLPSYGAMLYNPRHWTRWTKAQWVAWVEAQP